MNSKYRFFTTTKKKLESGMKLEAKGAIINGEMINKKNKVDGKKIGKELCRVESN